MKRLRQSTVEPVFGSLIHHYGMRKVGVHGKAGAHKVMLMAAIAFNLKKFMSFKPVEVASMAIALENKWEYAFSDYPSTFTALFYQLRNN
jgi:hypothetical protein